MDFESFSMIKGFKEGDVVEVSAIALQRLYRDMKLKEMELQETNEKLERCYDANDLLFNENSRLRENNKELKDRLKASENDNMILRDKLRKASRTNDNMVSKLVMSNALSEYRKNQLMRCELKRPLHVDV
jgi:predicted nuclease with TOPRIM domain